MQKKFLGFAEHQKKGTYGLGFLSTLAINFNKYVLNNAGATVIVDAKLVMSCIDLFVPQYTPNVEQWILLSQQSLSITPTELQYVKRTNFRKYVNP